MAKARYDQIVVFDERPDEFEFCVPGYVLAVGKKVVHVVLFTRVGKKEENFNLFFERDDASTYGMSSWDQTGNWKIDSVWTK